MTKDTLFNTPITKKFEFDHTVASVFDDMINRSVPYYRQMIEMTAHIATRYLQPHDRVYDLGCSTATTLIELARTCEAPLDLVGYDNSGAMLEQAKLKAQAFDTPITLIEGDILQATFENASVMISLFTLQFIRPLDRLTLITKIANGLKKGGVFIFAEKVITEDKRLDTIMIDLYHRFKEDQGYSQTQIMQKRAALENVLVPYTVAENEKMVKDAGFKHVEILFKYNNFALFVAIR